MSAGAWVMLAIGAIGLWGGLIVSIRHYFNAEKRARNTGGEG